MTVWCCLVTTAPNAITEPEVTIAVPQDRARVLDSLVAAFSRDPVLGFLFPERVTFPAYAEAFFGRLFDKRVHRETVWTIGDGASVAMWDPPSSGEGTDPASLADQLPADALARVDAYDDVVHQALPTSPFWYLGVLGTHPDHAGKRWGRAVMATGLRRAATDELPAILETSNPANVELYRRAGWRVWREATLDTLKIWVMRQDPARS